MFFVNEVLTVLLLNGKFEPGRTLNKRTNLSGPTSLGRTVRLETPRRFEKIVFWVPTTTALLREPLYPTYSYSTVSPDYSSAFSLIEIPPCRREDDSCLTPTKVLSYHYRPHIHHVVSYTLARHT